MIFKFAFLAVFVAGLALAVYSMLHGVERSSRRGERRPSAVFNTPTAAVLAIVLGAVGYLLSTRSGLGLFAILLIAIGAASVATIAAIALLARWALPHAGSQSDEDTTQGLLAVVTRSILPSEPGEISFQANGVHHTVSAQSIQGEVIPRDTEVVIDTIRDGVAQVEPWSTVEQRL